MRTVRIVKHYRSIEAMFGSIHYRDFKGILRRVVMEGIDNAIRKFYTVDDIDDEFIENLTSKVEAVADPEIVMPVFKEALKDMLDVINIAFERDDWVVSTVSTPGYDTIIVTAVTGGYAYIEPAPTEDRGTRI